MPTTYCITALGLGAILLIVVNAWWTGTDAISMSIATVVIAAVVIIYALWHLPRPLIAAGIIIVAVAVGLLV